ncbi:MAG: type II toxin-antitoxin system RelE/ParE family toxin [Acidobacteriota bacterium]|nr:type II toxin-antitoxin system RelE/ParE family toxin [Acidobacteriota bacterium]
MAARVRDVAWAESARDALDTVIEYIAQDSRQAAVQVLDEALRAAASLATFAERGRVVPELNDPAIREVFVHKYRLQYEVGNSRVLVVALLHGARDFATWRQSQQPE